jgi:hypothetical protein
MNRRVVWRKRNVGDILMLPLLPEDIENACQVTNYCKISGIGSPLPILGKITTSPAIRALKGQRRGSFSILGMEIIEAKFSPLDTWETSVFALHYTFADADGFPLS